MAARLIEPAEGTFERAVEIDGGRPDSEWVFIETTRPHGLTELRNCFALDRADFIRAVKEEFGLVDPLEYALEGGRSARDEL